MKKISIGKNKRDIYELAVSLGIGKKKVKNALKKLGYDFPLYEDELAMFHKLTLYFSSSEKLDGAIDIYKKFIPIQRERWESITPDRKKFIVGIEKLIKESVYLNEDLEKLEEQS